MIYLHKTQPAPACLEKEKAKKSGSYNCGDVLERLNQDFHNKCYLCESKAPTSLNIEHRVPHQGNVDLKFDWNNLFYVCGYCNNIKLAKFNDILDCTQESDHVETFMRYELDISSMTVNVLLTLIESNPRAVETQELLGNIYNGINTKNKRLASDNLRKMLRDEILSFHRLLDRYCVEINDDEKSILKQKIELSLKSDSAFTAFKRWIIRNNETLFTEFGECLK